MVFGRWKEELVEATRDIHARKPVDLLLTSASPYTFFAPALDLWEQSKVPFILDYRDAWAIDIINDKPAFTPTSRKGRIERRLMDAAHEAWFVNTPIRDAYAELYPERGKDFHVVRNGSDVAIGTDRIPLRQPGPEEGLTFGYLGTVTFTPNRTRDICEGWKLAGERSELIARSQLHFRGHIGAGAARGVNAHSRIINSFGRYGVSFGGPVAKGDTAAVYASWDALMLCLVGGRYVTSGKVYDYISTGLPVMSVHEKDHAATEILAEYPLWVQNEGLEPEQLADAFIETAKLVDSASVEDRERARRYAERYERYAQIQPAVDRLTSQFTATAKVPPSDRASAPTPHADHQTIAFVYTSPPTVMVVDSIKRIREQGGRVVILGPQIKGYEKAADVADGGFIFLRQRFVPVYVDPDNRPRRYSLPWASIVARNLTRKATQKPAKRVLGPPRCGGSPPSTTARPWPCSTGPM